ncbi:hypothetical protein C6P92_13935 [Burkholderia multivorans]|nr:hypothetical protein C6P92_13935 [Burkholderia multivorans]PRF31978.1 hypothetical protein C6Q08_16325 [Burkholderia multivorans]PRG46061.1 hypothetical protein C6T62_05155 [Burkholderia multivorans]PRH25550.1 hypothetical protein C6T53_15785 [Burkholderia multivorans]
MISQRRGYAISECDARLVERLGDRRSCPKDAFRSPRQNQKSPKGRQASGTMKYLASELPLVTSSA